MVPKRGIKPSSNAAARDPAGVLGHENAPAPENVPGQDGEAHGEEANDREVNDEGVNGRDVPKGTSPRQLNLQSSNKGGRTKRKAQWKDPSLNKGTKWDDPTSGEPRTTRIRKLSSKKKDELEQLCRERDISPSNGANKVQLAADLVESTMNQSWFKRKGQPPDLSARPPAPAGSKKRRKTKSTKKADDVPIWIDEEQVHEAFYSIYDSEDSEEPKELKNIREQIREFANDANECHHSLRIRKKPDATSKRRADDPAYSWPDRYAAAPSEANRTSALPGRPWVPNWTRTEDPTMAAFQDIVNDHKAFAVVKSSNGDKKAKQFLDDYGRWGFMRDSSREISRRGIDPSEDIQDGAESSDAADEDVGPAEKRRQALGKEKRRIQFLFDYEMNGAVKRWGPGELKRIMDESFNKIMQRHHEDDYGNQGNTNGFLPHPLERDDEQPLGPGSQDDQDLPGPSKSKGLKRTHHREDGDELDHGRRQEKKRKKDREGRGDPPHQKLLKRQRDDENDKGRKHGQNERKRRRSNSYERPSPAQRPFGDGSGLDYGGDTHFNGPNSGSVHAAKKAKHETFSKASNPAETPSKPPTESTVEGTESVSDTAYVLETESSDEDDDTRGGRKIWKLKPKQKNASDATPEASTGQAAGEVNDDHQGSPPSQATSGREENEQVDTSSWSVENREGGQKEEAAQGSPRGSQSSNSDETSEDDEPDGISLASSSTDSSKYDGDGTPNCLGRRPLSISSSPSEPADNLDQEPEELEQDENSHPPPPTAEELDELMQHALLDVSHEGNGTSPNADPDDDLDEVALPSVESPPSGTAPRPSASKSPQPTDSNRLSSSSTDLSEPGEFPINLNDLLVPGEVILNDGDTFFYPASEARTSRYVYPLGRFEETNSHSLVKRYYSPAEFDRLMPTAPWRHPDEMQADQRGRVLQALRRARAEGRIRIWSRTFSTEPEVRRERRQAGGKTLPGHGTYLPEEREEEGEEREEGQEQRMQTVELVEEVRYLRRVSGDKTLPGAGATGLREQDWHDVDACELDEGAQTVGDSNRKDGDENGVRDDGDEELDEQEDEDPQDRRFC